MQKEHEGLLEEVALCSAWITHDTDIDITTEICAFLGNFMNATEQHQQNSTFYLVITCRQSENTYRVQLHQLQ